VSYDLLGILPLLEVPKESLGRKEDGVATATPSSKDTILFYCGASAWRAKN